MSQRRMISLEVVDTDAFLDMSQSSQLLYFHLSIRADDDGFVSNPRKIARTLGVGIDDMKILIGKKFIIAFDDGICVIKHWRINNFIRKDIYKETKYLNLKQTLFIRPNGAYTLNDDGNAIPVPKGHFQLDSVNGSLTERQLSIGKGSIGKNNKENDFDKFWNLYPLKVQKKKAEVSWNRLSEANRAAALADVPCRKFKEGFIPHPTTYLNGERWNDEEIKTNKFGL